jgi:predicted small lipoprotein YifL
MKRWLTVVVSLMLLGSLAGCGGARRVVLPPGASNAIAVLPLGADTASLTGDQIELLRSTLDWMNRDLVNSLNRRGFGAVLIGAEQEFSREGHLLRVKITAHKLIPRGARAWAGMMAGADRIDAHYELVDAAGATVLAWDDGKASTSSSRAVCQALNRGAAQKVATQLGAR